MSQNASQLAFVFPGQGSQTVGMTAELAEAYPEDVHSIFAEASLGAGVDLLKLAQYGPEETLNRTENTQPVLLAASIAVWRIWQQLDGPKPACMAGHSLGEYSALVASGALGLRDAAALVAERGRLMQSSMPMGSGAMAAVLGAEEDLIADVCAEVAEGQVVAPANFNAPGQVVIAGHAQAVSRTLALLAKRGVRKVIRLPVSVPSHCELMREAASQLAERMAEISWNMPETRVVQNVEARAYGSVEYIHAALERQLYMPVRWTDCVQTLIANGTTRLAECGPGKVLTGLARRIDRSLDARPLGTPSGLQAALAAWR